MHDTEKGWLAFKRTQMILANKEDVLRSLQNELPRIFSFIAESQETPCDRVPDPSTHRFIVQLPNKKPKRVDVKLEVDETAGKVVLKPVDPNVGPAFWIGFHLIQSSRSTKAEVEVKVAPKIMVRWGCKNTVKGRVNEFMDGLLIELADYMRNS